MFILYSLFFVIVTVFGGLLIYIFSEIRKDIKELKEKANL